MTVVFPDSETETPKKSHPIQRSPFSGKRTRKGVHRENITRETSMSEKSKLQIIEKPLLSTAPLAQEMGNHFTNTTDIKSMHDSTSHSISTNIRESDCMRELASIVPAHVFEDSSPFSIFSSELEDCHLLGISTSNGSAGPKNIIADDTAQDNVRLKNTNKETLPQESLSPGLAIHRKVKYQKKSPERTQKDFTVDIAWQCLGISEGRSLFWNGIECLFYSSPQFPQDAEYLTQFNPFFQILSRIRRIIARRTGFSSLYLQGLICGVQDQLYLFEKDVTKLIASNEISHFSLTSLKFHYLPIMQLLLRLLKDTENLCGGKILFICSEMHTYATKQCQKIISDVVAKVIAPFFRMARSWLCNGELSDPFNDFFICSGLPMVEGKVCRWEETFSLALERVPPACIPGISTIFSSALLNDILLVGKTVHFLRKMNSCNETESEAISLRSLDMDSDWAEYIRKRKQEVSGHLLHIYEIEYRIGDHIRFCIDFLLLHNSGFADLLCKTLMISPERDVKDDVGKKIQNILDGQLRTNAYSTSYYSLPQYMELKTRNYPRNWHKKFAITRENLTAHNCFFSMPYLRYAPQGYISIIFTTEICNGLAEIHVFLLRVKLIVHLLEKHWKCPQLLPNFSRQVNAVYNKCIHFIRKVHHFIIIDILGPHIAALYFLIHNRQIIEEAGFIEGMRMILNGFVHQVQACFLLCAPADSGPDKLRILTATKFPKQQADQKKVELEKVTAARQTLHHLLDLCVVFVSVQSKVQSLSRGIGNEQTIFQSLRELDITFDFHMNVFLQQLDTEPLMQYKFISLMRSSIYAADARSNQGKP